MSETDLDDLTQWRAGDRAAGTRLFRRYLPDVRSFFVNKAPREDLDDLVQETFMGCVRGREQFRGDVKFRTYLISIARRVLANFYRARKSRHVRDHVDIDSHEVADTGPRVGALIAKSRQHELLVTAMRAIELDDQIMLELYYWQNWTAEEIGVVYEMALGTIRGRIARAKKNFRAELERTAGSLDEFHTTFAAFEAKTWAAEIHAQLENYEPKHFRRVAATQGAK
ncbi:MAG: RNA polymerase sigma factor [Nannocystaceae bacterium]